MTKLFVPRFDCMNKFSKKQKLFFSILLFTCISVLYFVYMLTFNVRRNQVSIFENNVPASIVHEITNDKIIEQTFHSQFSSIRSISLMFGTYIRKNPGKMVLEVLKDGGILASSQINLFDIPDNSYYPFKFDQSVKLDKGQQYVLRISAPESSTGNAVALYKTDKTSPNSQLSVNGQQEQGNLVVQVNYISISYVINMFMFFLCFFYVFLHYTFFIFRNMNNYFFSSVVMIYHYLKNNLFLFFSIALTLLFTFGYAIVNFTLTIDGELVISETYQDLVIWALKLGRPVMALINKLFWFYQYFPPFSAQLFSVILLFLTVLVYSATFTKLCSGINRFALFVFSIMLTSFPAIITEYFIFNGFNISIGFSFLFMSLASYFLADYLKNKNNFSLVFLVLFQFCAIGTYQGFIPAMAVSLVIVLFLYYYNTEVTFKQLIVNALLSLGSFLLSLLIYVLINKLIRMFVFSNNYAENYLIMNISNDIIARITSCYYYYLNSYGGKYLNISIFLLGYSLVLVLLGNKRVYLKICLFIMLLGIFFAPYLLGVFVVNYPVYRSCQIFLLSNAFIWFLIFVLLRQQKIVKFTIVLVSMFVMMYQVQTVNRIFFADHMKYQQDIRIVQQIMDRIMYTTGTMKIDKQLVFLGNLPADSRPWVTRIQQVNENVFNWNATAIRLPYFISALGYDVLHTHSVDNYREEAQQLAKDIPVWPHSESIKYTDNFIIIKLSNF